MYWSNISFDVFGSRVCGNPHGLIRKYGLMCCRQCFRSNAKDIGFIKVCSIMNLHYFRETVRSSLVLFAASVLDIGYVVMDLLLQYCLFLNQIVAVLLTRWLCEWLSGYVVVVCCGMPLPIFMYSFSWMMRLCYDMLACFLKKFILWIDGLLILLYASSFLV